MYGSRRNPEFRPLGRFAPVAVNSGLRPETRRRLLLPKGDAIRDNCGSAFRTALR